MMSMRLQNTIDAGMTHSGQAPLSFEQEHLWRAGCVPNIPPMALLLKGTLNVAALAKALDQMIERHAALRTIVRDSGNGPAQEILPTMDVKWIVEDLTGTSEDCHRTVAHHSLRGHGMQPFDVSRGPLLRIGLLRLADLDHILFFTMHHIISDLWSFRIFIQELAAFYTSHADNQPLALEPPGMHY